MRHTREEVIRRENQEFERLDRMVANLTDAEWHMLLHRPETKDPWTVKDALAHITHWKADTARKARKQRRPLEERGLNVDDGNRLIYLRWRDRSPREVLDWHRQVHQEVISALESAPEEWFGGRERNQQWPYDLDGHSVYHRIHDIERALQSKTSK